MLALLAILISGGTILCVLSLIALHRYGERIDAEFMDRLRDPDCRDL